MIERLEAVVNGETVTSEIRTNGVSPEETLAIDGVFDTGIEDLTGYLTIKDVTNESTSIALCHLHNGAQVIESISGSANIGSAKNTASKLNAYVEGGIIKIQNKTGAEVVFAANII